MATKTKTKKSISSLKKQKVDGKKVKGGISAGSIHGASSNELTAGSAHNVSGMNTNVVTKGNLSGVPGLHKINPGKKYTR